MASNQANPTPFWICKVYGSFCLPPHFPTTAKPTTESSSFIYLLIFGLLGWLLCMLVVVGIVVFWCVRKRRRKTPEPLPPPPPVPGTAGGGGSASRSTVPDKYGYIDLASLNQAPPSDPPPSNPSAEPATPTSATPQALQSAQQPTSGSLS